MRTEDYKNTKPEIKIEEYFLGNVKAWGIFQGRSGVVKRSFTAAAAASSNSSNTDSGNTTSTSASSENAPTDPKIIDGKAIAKSTAASSVRMAYLPRLSTPILYLPSYLEHFICPVALVGGIASTRALIPSSRSLVHCACSFP